MVSKIKKQSLYDSAFEFKLMKIYRISNSSAKLFAMILHSPDGSAPYIVRLYVFSALEPDSRIYIGSMKPGLPVSAEQRTNHHFFATIKYR